MTLAEVYEHNAKECRQAAERTCNAAHRAMLLKTASEWWQDAEALRDQLRYWTARDRKAENPRAARKAPRRKRQCRTRSPGFRS